MNIKPYLIQFLKYILVFIILISIYLITLTLSGLIPSEWMKDNVTKSSEVLYEEGEKKLQPSGQSILQTCGKLVKLGAKQSDKNPLPQLMDIDDIPAIGDEASMQ